ncbi:MAG: NAD-dependent epimerase/dehydratase family protein [Anditalea sp.]
MERILITGAAGQLGSELTQSLTDIHGGEAVIATDIHQAESGKFPYCRFATLDVMDRDGLGRLIKEENIKQIYHLAAILSAASEKNPHFAWQVNMESLLYVLEFAKELNLEKVYWPSSIAVFGPHSPRHNTPQHCIMDPDTVYGISKQAGERWCAYYFQQHQVDVRSLRYPGLIGYKSPPGGGTTDYAVDIYHKAIVGEHFECFLSEETYLPMMYMPDAIKATIDLMQAPRENIKIRSSYNLGGISISPKELFQSIKEHYPPFQISYKPDFRQKIADSWPNSIDDSAAKNDWGWQHEFGLKTMTEDIFKNLPEYLPYFKQKS